MSTGKRLAKRSIVGTRVCARGDDGKYYAATIQAIKTPASSFMDQHQNTNCIHLTPNTRYTVLFDRTTGYEGRDTAEFFESELIGPGFQTIMGLELLPGQRCYVTHNGREVSGMVTRHYVNSDDVLIEIYLPGCTEQPFLVHKRLEEVRLLESRKSARLADTDTDFARLADMGSERKRQASNTIDVPLTSTSSQIGSRKRRPSNSQDDIMDECSAAMVLMSLSISPHHQYLQQQQPFQQQMGTSPESAICSGSGSNRSTPSPASRGDSPQNVYASSYDDGIDMEMEEQPKRKKRVAFRCTWPNCMVTSSTLSSIEYHVRNEHDVGTGELLEFYYNEVEVDPTSSPSTVNHNHHHSAPTLSHRDMARPPHEDPDYQRQLVGSYRQSLLSSSPGSGPQSPYKVLRLTTPHHHHQSPHTIVGGLNHPTITTAVAAASPPLTKTPASPRRVRGENKKCRKNYGMENRDQWCTSCRWKKACTRFADILGDQRLVKTVSYTSSGSSLQHQQQQHHHQQQQQQNPSVCSL